MPEEELKALINESHLHAPAIDMTEVIRESVEAMKIRCSIEPNKNPSEIFDEERKVLELKYKNVALIAEHLPQFEEIKGALYKRRSKFYPTIPRTMEDLFNNRNLFEDFVEFLFNVFIS